jgi:hypothetical protein
MEVIIESISKILSDPPSWWFTIFVAIMIGIIGGLLKNLPGKLISHFSESFNKRRINKKQDEETWIELLTNNPIILIANYVYGLVYTLILILFLILTAIISRLLGSPMVTIYVVWCLKAILISIVIGSTFCTYRITYILKMAIHAHQLHITKVRNFPEKDLADPSSEEHKENKA